MKKLFHIFLLLMILLVGCSEEDSDSTEPAVNINTIIAVKKIYTPVLEYSGTIFAFKEANLGAALPGRVEKIYFDEGQYVKNGQLIAELSGEMKLQAEVAFQTYKKDFERVSRLYKKGSLSEQKYDHVKAEFEASKARYNMMKKNTEIRAPFNGTVVEHMLNEGENFFLNPGLEPGYSHTSGILRLMQLNRLKVKIDVIGKELPNIFKGQRAKIAVDSYPDTVFTGAVINIQQMLSTLSRTATVDIMINNPEQILKPGMYCTVTLELPEKEAVFIPREALIRQQGTGDRYVFVVKEGSAERREVKPIVSLNEDIAVKGVQAGERVVTGGKNKLKSGSLVNMMSGSGGAR